MKLLDLHISGFGKLHDRDISFEDGLNVVYGKNEAGKSTLHTFIRCMLFGLERGRGRASRNDLYSRCEPWDKKMIYGGWMRVEQNGITYRIERNFHKDQKSLVIVDETNGREIQPTKTFFDQLLCGLTETTYMNTISIGQLKSATDSGMVSELRNYIANMNTSGSMALNITKATSYLQARRRGFERQLHPDAAKDYASLTSEIRRMEQEISAPEYENQLLTYQTMRSQVQNLLAEKQEEREALLQKLATGRQALSGAQFTDEASVVKYRDETQATYNAYTAAKTACSKKAVRFFAGLFLVLALACAAFTGLFAAWTSGLLSASTPGAQLAAFLPAGTPDTQLAASSAISAAGITGTGAVLTLAFAAAGILLFVRQRQNRKELAYSTKLLQEVFSRHLGDSAISDEALQAFNARMEEFIRLSQILIKSEASLKEQAEEITALQKRSSSCDEVISKQQRTQWELEKKLDRLAACKDQIESLKRTLAENERIREEIAAIDLALETMTELSASIRSSFGHYLNKTASDMIREITGGIYDSMSVDENLNAFMNTPTKLVPISQVSSGTMDQIYLALRLAAARLIQSGKDELPLIFDDSFVLYDDERLRCALKWLAQAYGGQIIIFTCHRREAQMLTANQISYHLITI